MKIKNYVRLLALLLALNISIAHAQAADKTNMSSEQDSSHGRAIIGLGIGGGMYVLPSSLTSETDTVLRLSFAPWTLFSNGRVLQANLGYLWYRSYFGYGAELVYTNLQGNSISCAESFSEPNIHTTTTMNTFSLMAVGKLFTSRDGQGLFISGKIGPAFSLQSFTGSYDPPAYPNKQFDTGVAGLALSGGVGIQGDHFGWMLDVQVFRRTRDTPNTTGFALITTGITYSF